jgi:hypothetical protein
MLVTPMPLPPTDILMPTTALPMAKAMANATSSWHSSANRPRSLRHRPKHRLLQRRLHLSSPAHHRRPRLPPITTSSTSSTLPQQRRNLPRDRVRARRHLQHQPFNPHTDQPTPGLLHRHPSSPAHSPSNSRTHFSTCSRSLPTPSARRWNRPCRRSHWARRTECVMEGTSSKSRNLDLAV